MFRLIKVFFIISIFAELMLPSHSARATVEVTTGFVSERKTTFISLHHEDVSPFPVLVAELAQNVDALDNLFHRLLNAGQLLSSYPILAIEISDDVYQGVLSTGPRVDGFAVLSLENNYRLDLDPHDVLSADTIGLGPVYRVELTLWPISVNELLTLVLLLPELSADNPRIELLAADIRQYRDKFDDKIRDAAKVWSHSDLLWSLDGNLLLWAGWDNRGLNYHVFNFIANERMSLDRLEHYILPPTFSPDSRFIVYASQIELKIVDVVRQKTQSFSLQDKMPYSYQGIDWITVAFNETADSLFLSIGGWKEIPIGLLWRGPVPGLAELKNMTEWHEEYFTEFGRSAGFGVPAPGIWSDFFHRRHSSVVKTPFELSELKEKMTVSTNVELAVKREKLQVKYGAVYSEKINYPRNDHLAVLIEAGDRLEARVLSLPSLKEIDKFMFTLLPPKPQHHIPGTIAGISLFNIIVMMLILLIATGITKLILFLKQKYTRQPTATICIKKKLLFFTGALLITLLLHFVATICVLGIVDDDMGERAVFIAEQAIKQRYAEFGYTVDLVGGGFKSMAGNSYLSWVDFPYQVLYWRLSGYTQFVAPIDIGFAYRVSDTRGNFVKGKGARYYVFGVDRLIKSYLPW